ncbi:MAG: zf-HC2 domain-containing protein [Desulfobacteraceae bacterium]|nr:zf-HC2 domain-containing protein [Desulfobacteraceae bacterium]
MDCSQVRRYVSAFMDEELDGEKQNRVAGHLAGCRECAQYFREYARVDARLSELPRIDAAPGFASRVMAAAAEHAAAPEAASPLSRLLRIFAGIFEEITRIFEPGHRPDTRILDEFDDCPPLSMSFAYLNLLQQSPRG